jgi:hypothetical protein
MYFTVKYSVRKGISILFALLMMLSASLFTVATHYCGGKVAATKVSLSGKLASCGMESDEKGCPSAGKHLKTHCCDDKISAIGIVNIFTCSFPHSDEINQNLTQLYYIPVRQSLHFLTVNNSVDTSKSPPEAFVSKGVDLSSICIFRI